ncbi:hypothetical protein HaLaN_04480 [Haematococcus lacustris]|uniref:Uncharacterized protein n=1 Tax=Haematococcus lacustris TaxID=44745 RepID=A0A699YNJ9_HAELA|nr:hypothetical protein HaLaN_04480 [Haematococcus lacustris]
MGCLFSAMDVSDQLPKARQRMHRSAELSMDICGGLTIVFYAARGPRADRPAAAARGGKWPPGSSHPHTAFD